MSNQYFQFTGQGELIPGTLARAEDVNESLRGIESGFDKLPDPAEAPLKGFSGAVAVGEATLGVHAVRKSVVDALQAATEAAIAEVRDLLDELPAKVRLIVREEFEPTKDVLEEANQRTQVLRTFMQSIQALLEDVLAKTAIAQTKLNGLETTLGQTQIAVNEVSDLSANIEQTIEAVSGNVDELLNRSEAIQSGLSTALRKLLDIEESIDGCCG